MRRRWGDGGICGVGKMAWWRNTDKKWRQKYKKKTRKKNPKKSVCRRGGPICCNRQLWDYRQHRHQTMIVGDVCVSVQGGGAIMYYPPPSPPCIPLSLSFSLPPTAALMGHSLSFAHCGNWCMWGGVTCAQLPLCVCQRIRKWNSLKSAVRLPSSSKMTHFHYSLGDRTDFSVRCPPAYIMICNSEDNLYREINFAKEHLNKWMLN